MELSLVTTACDNYALIFNYLVAVTVFDFWDVTQLSLKFNIKNTMKVLRTKLLICCYT